MKIEISPLAAADIEELAALARSIWQDAYAQLISQAQIDSMLAQRYDAALLRAELARDDLWWDKAIVDGRLAAFAASFRTAVPGEMKLDKLYVATGLQRFGIGRRLIAQVAERALALGCASLILAVNKRNAGAIAAYRRNGFEIADAVCVDIGNGFVMDDFIMRKSLR